MSLINNSGFILILSLIPALIMSYYARVYILKHYEGHERFQFVSISVAFFIILNSAICLFLNRASMSNCETEIRTIESYNSLFVSAYGRTKSDVSANRFEVTFLDEHQQHEVYVLRSNVFTADPSGHRVKVQFCTSIFGLKMYKEIVELIE